MYLIFRYTEYSEYSEQTSLQFPSIYPIIRDLMIKTVSKTIFVLSLFAILGVSINTAEAAEKITSCKPLGTAYVPLVLSTPQKTSTFHLYTSFQEPHVRVPASYTFIANDKTQNENVHDPIIGESEVEELIPTISDIPPLPESSQSQPTQEPTNDGSLSADALFAMVNQVRSASGLTPFMQDERICSVAASRGPELYNEIMVTGTMHAGFYARNLPYWATENVIYQQTEQQALNWWMGSSVHRSAILGDYQYACGTCIGKACNMIFTNFAPKQSAPTAI